MNLALEFGWMRWRRVEWGEDFVHYHLAAAEQIETHILHEWVGLSALCYNAMYILSLISDLLDSKNGRVHVAHDGNTTYVRGGPRKRDSDRVEP